MMKCKIAAFVFAIMMISWVSGALAADESGKTSCTEQTADVSVDDLENNKIEIDEDDDAASVEIVEMPTASFVEIPIAYDNYNEAEWIIKVREASPSEYSKLGVEADDVEEMQEIDLEAAFLERSQMSEEQLKALGHTDEEIMLLKAYDGSTITGDSAVVAASPRCTGGYYLKCASASEINFRYKWEWSALPFFQDKDKATVFLGSI